MSRSDRAYIARTHQGPKCSTKKSKTRHKHRADRAFAQIKKSDRKRPWVIEKDERK